jgi:hypothetical protein
MRYPLGERGVRDVVQSEEKKRRHEGGHSVWS